MLAGPYIPTTIKQALSCEDKELWKQSAIAEVNNFLKRESWIFIPKSAVKAIRSKLISVKLVLNVKHEPDYSMGYKSRFANNRFIQIPGIDYSEKFSAVAQVRSVQVVLALVLFLFWECELVNI